MYLGLRRCDFTAVKNYFSQEILTMRIYNMYKCIGMLNFQMIASISE